ncbi:WXG100 family type VII secretion target [Actinacidiphila alni]|jgi:uncharacterized protein YukE|uniref:Proteins of 100 residues with WXG n=1 Tax=Actinacidiphila alni TaxID=380248 RepID=A0A1I1XKB9_9ACTN|nr:WXG100 family type VII secretion target [Actinacidiphila alni]SFE07651.1 Proteins of 100 residues with WXG [Actinacidiphila alni]
MPNISLDYEKIETTSSKLDTANENIVPMLNQLRTDVNNLLDDGMVFEQSSAALKESYEKFNSSLLLAVKGIKDFAEQFRGIKKSMADNDADLAKKIRDAANG